uniref:Uncharacterized protein n=1 Tax=Mucochytrium quahogii TaxID=96639 RepID=A0A7S2WPE6_9STRA|mmetsp:Transcript_12726/g.20574  ORF Transcript_12726/g.20574 Transcript_12726/m.20574 type:complete len:116 (+) Transcript_12726:374-721(+)
MKFSFGVLFSGIAAVSTAVDSGDNVCGTYYSSCDNLRGLNSITGDEVRWIGQGKNKTMYHYMFCHEIQVKQKPIPQDCNLTQTDICKEQQPCYEPLQTCHAFVDTPLNQLCPFNE